jgi:hypothetical protein
VPLFKLSAASIPMCCTSRRFPDSPGWRVMVGSVWTSLLLMSVIGLFHPWSLAWVLVWQFVYQVTWCVHPQAAVPALLR